MVGLAAKTVLGFTPPCLFSCKHPGLVHQQLEACRRGGGVCVWKVIFGLSVHPPAPPCCTNRHDKRSFSLGKIFPPSQGPPFLS